MLNKIKSLSASRKQDLAVCVIAISLICVSKVVGGFKV